MPQREFQCRRKVQQQKRKYKNKRETKPQYGKNEVQIENEIVAHGTTLMQ